MINDKNNWIYIIADFMSFVFNDTDCAMDWFFENTACWNHDRIDNCWGDIILSELIHLRKEFL